MALLKWLGETEITFANLPGAGLLSPGDEFEVPDKDVERFTRRSDIVPAKPGNGAKTSAPSDPAPSDS